MDSAQPAALADLDDQALAEEIARRAGELLLEIRTEGLGGKALGQHGDRRSDDLVADLLAAARPGDAVLSEESEDDLDRVSASRVWIIDPVDGTREYAMPPRVDWAVHVALWTDDGDPARARLSAAAVALPALGVVYGTSAEADPEPRGLLPEREDEAPRIVKSGSRPPAFLDAVADAIGGRAVPLGSAGAKAMAVVRGEADAYVHAGGQYQWDSAAPAGVALARGFAACRIDGSPLEYNVADRYLPDLVICRPDLRDRILSAIATHQGSSKT